jgi:hypothetical protein
VGILARKYHFVKKKRYTLRSGELKEQILFPVIWGRMKVAYISKLHPNDRRISDGNNNISAQKRIKIPAGY